MAIVVATTTTSIRGRRGEKIIIKAGDAWDEDSPVVRTHPDLFSAEPDKALGGDIPADTFDAPVERKTAVPGERANVKRGR